MISPPKTYISPLNSQVYEIPREISVNADGMSKIALRREKKT